MRRSHLYLVGFAAFIAACQPIAPSVVTPSSPQAEDNAVAKQGTDTPSIKKTNNHHYFTDNRAVCNC